MISVFRGWLLPRFYWGCAWQGRRGKYCLKALKHLFSIWKLELYLTAYYNDEDPYKEEALDYLKQFVDMKTELVGAHPNDLWMLYCVSKQDGSCIGLPEDVNIYLRMGIETFYKAHPDDNTASIGAAPGQKRWYGWSHRAICSFGIGHAVEEDSLVRSSGWIEECQEYVEDEKTKPAVGFKAETLEDCRYLAIRFAGAVR